MGSLTEMVSLYRGLQARPALIRLLCHRWIAWSMARKAGQWNAHCATLFIGRDSSVWLELQAVTVYTSDASAPSLSISSISELLLLFSAFPSTLFRYFLSVSDASQLLLPHFTYLRATSASIEALSHVPSFTFPATHLIILFRLNHGRPSSDSGCGQGCHGGYCAG